MHTGFGATKWLAALAMSVATLAGCGGGGVADPFDPGPSAPAFVVRPTTVEATSGTPVTITVVSGVGPFLAFSSNPGVLPVTQAVSGAAITVTPNAVSSATGVTLTIRDALGREAPVGVNVNPGTVLNAVQVTPLANTACGSASPPAPVPVCSGDTASISTLVRNAGVTPVAGRQVRFDVVQGAFAFSLNPAGTSTAPSTTVISDQNGIANAVIKVAEGATSQVAMVRATDTITGNRVDTVFTIVQQVNGQAVLSVVPTGYVGQAFYKGECGGTSGDFLVYGGQPPYTVRSSLPNAIQLSYNGVVADPVIIPRSGDRFRASTQFQTGCAGYKGSIVITDANGRNFTATYEEKEGTNERPAPPPPASLVITPASVSLVAVSGNCGGRSIVFAATGGTPGYTFSSSEPARGSVSGSTLSTTSLFAPGNTITVSVLDSAGKIASATVTCQ